MSAGRRTSLVVALMTCLALACTVSVSLAQSPSSDVPASCAPADVPTLSMAPSTGMGASTGLASSFLGLPLGVRLSLAAYRWLQPVMDRPSTPEGRALSASRTTPAFAAWRRR